MRALSVFLLVGVFAACGDDGPAGMDDASELSATDEGGGAITSIDFGSTGRGGNVLGRVTLKNTGAAPTSPLALAIGGDAANDFAFDNTETTCAARTLTPLATCDIVVAFHPTTNGARDAMLVVAGASGTPLTILLHGLGADLGFQPSSLDFGQVETPMTTIKTISLVNEGTDPAPIDSIDITGNFHIAASACGSTLAAGESCDIIVRLQPALGTNAGTLSVMSASTSVDAPLLGAGAHRVTVVRAGGGTGTVTSAPNGINCGTTCEHLFDAAITVTATPDSGSAFTGWSIPSCGSATACAIPADVDPVTVRATFVSTASSSVQITFAGNGPGEIAVYRSATLLARCVASCSVPIMAGDTVGLLSNTPSTYGGITGACTATSTQADCAFTAAAGTNAVTATFNKDAKEQWTRLLPEQVIGVAQDGSGNVLAATMTTLYKLSSTGTTLWSQALPISCMATGPSDTIYLVSGANLQKLDASGTQLWSVATGTGVSCFESASIAVGADGSVALQGFKRWDASGTPTATVAITAPRNMITMDSSSVIYSAFNYMGGTAIRRFQSNGTENTPQWLTNGQLNGQMAIDSGGQLVMSTSGNGKVYFARLTSTGGESYNRLYNPQTNTNAARNGVAASSTGNVLWWYMQNLEGGSGGNSYTAKVFSNTNADVWSMQRILPYYSFPGMVGVVPVSGTYRAAQVVLGGHYENLDGTAVGWIQAYAP